VGIPISKIKVGKVCGKGVGEVHGAKASTTAVVLSTKRNVNISGGWRILQYLFVTGGHFYVFVGFEN